MNKAKLVLLSMFIYKGSKETECALLRLFLYTRLPTEKNPDILLT